MTVIKPFKGIRPAKDKVHLVASRSVDGYKPAELSAKLAENPYTFLHIIKPKVGDKIKPGSLEYLKRIKLNYEEFLKEEILINDEEAAFYVYTQIKEGISFTGIIGCASIDDYLTGVIKIHEQTLTNKEEKLKDYLKVCDFNAEPVCLTYPADPTIDFIISGQVHNEPIYDFTTTDKVRHKLWKITEETAVNGITERFKNIPHIYIADGHHRSASSALLGKERRIQKPDFTGDEPFNYFLGIFFPDDQLKIYDFNRVVKDLNGLSAEEFLEKLSSRFSIEQKKEVYRPEQLHNFSMYLDGSWYSLNLKEGSLDAEDPVATLDASILSEYILSPILDIHDLKTDNRIGFVAGIKGMKELQDQVDSGKMKVAFGLYPVSMEQLKKIADSGSIMPPKSTWIEPKLRSALVIYSLS